MGKKTDPERPFEDRSDDLYRIAGLVMSLPEHEPPASILDNVMARVKPKKLGWLRRLVRFVRTPAPVSPLWPALAGALAAVLLMAALSPDPRGPERGPVAEGSEKAAPARNVLFTLDMPEASSVDLIGSFNQWSPGRFKMRWDSSQERWNIRIKLEEGRYEYAFLVDGERTVPDPGALFQERDGFGNTNSILVIQRGNGHETGI